MLAHKNKKCIKPCKYKGPSKLPEGPCDSYLIIDGEAFGCSFDSNCRPDQSTDKDQLSLPELQ